MAKSLITNFEPSNTNLLLIDNKTKLDLNSCYNIIKKEFPEDYVVYNNTLIEKELLINHLPLEEADDGYLRSASALRWNYVAKFSRVILITDSDLLDEWQHDKFIDAIFYRLITGKSMVLIVNGHVSKYSCFYPYFSTAYSTKDNNKWITEEITDIDDLDDFKEKIKEKFALFNCSHLTLFSIQNSILVILFQRNSIYFMF